MFEAQVVLLQNNDISVMLALIIIVTKFYFILKFPINVCGHNIIRNLTSQTMTSTNRSSTFVVVIKRSIIPQKRC